MLTLLKILALGNKQIAECRVKPVAEVVKRLRARSPERRRQSHR